MLIRLLNVILNLNILHLSMTDEERIGHLTILLARNHPSSQKLFGKYPKVLIKNFFFLLFYSISHSLNTSLAAPGALAHHLQRPTACNT